MKVTRADLGIDLKGMPEEQRTFMEKMCDIMCDTVNKAMEGNISKEEVENRFKSVNDSIKGVDSEKFAQVVKENEELRDVVKNLSEGVEKLKQKGIDANPVLAKASEAVNSMFESEKFQLFANGQSKNAVGFAIKDVSMTNDYTGVLPTQQSGDVVYRAKNRNQHIRDFATVLPCEPGKESFSWMQITDLDRNARYVSENGKLPESKFKMEEVRSDVKRAGHYFELSKNVIKDRVYLTAFLMTQAIEGVLNNEDSAILFGDGRNGNLKGITTHEGCKPIETIISDNIVSGAAGSVESVEVAGNGLVLTLKNAYDDLQEGMKITLAGATTNTALNATFDVVKINDRQMLLEGAKLDDASTDAKLAADVAALTWNVKSGAYKSISSPNSYDALETAVASLTYAEFKPSAILLNPITLNTIRSEKATNGNRLDVVRDLYGNILIGGLRVMECTSIPVGKYFIGDFINGAQILEYTGLTLSWLEDVNTNLTNKIVLMAQEQIILAVKNPWAFAYGSIAALKTAIAAS